MVGALARLGAIGAILSLGVALNMAQQDAPGAFACGAAGPYDFDTYEPEKYDQVYSRSIELATAGRAINGVYTVTSTAETVDLRFQGLTKGPRTARTTNLDKTLTIPPTIFKAIAWIESDWQSASTSVPYGGVGKSLRSFDCGYGIGQITSTMGNATGNATARQALIGTHFLYNIAEGVRILAEKWNSAPKFRPIAGNGDPSALEDWYFAIWSYNGFAFINHPLNPVFDPLRGEAWSCGNPAAPNADYTRGSFTYPEKVYGCMKNPPVRNNAKLWQAQVFDMPHFADERVAKAFDPKNYLDCSEADFANGCPLMDYPTTIPELKVVTHKDTTPPDPSATAAAFLGDPRLTYAGPTAVSLTGYADGTSTTSTVTVTNAGAGLGPYRIRTSVPWIRVHHPNDGLDRSLDGGVVVGADMEVVIQAPTASRPRIAQKGYASTLVIALAPSLMPPGQSTGKVWIEPLAGGGGVYEVSVTGNNTAAAAKYRSFLPGLASGN